MSVGVAPEQEPLIRLESISKLYGSGDAQVAALRNFSLRVAQGELRASRR